ncbi:MAG: carbohydrate kinase family protein [Clostridia bacterium]
MLGEERYVAVVGAVNVDISGTSDTPFVQGDSNPGHVFVTMGGVGRNIAENLSRLGLNVKLVAALGEDMRAAQVRGGCRALGIDLDHCLVVPKERTSTYLCLNDCNGVIVAAVSDMSICEAITPDFLQTKLDMLNHAALVVLEANLSKEAIDFLAQNCTAPLMADPVSTKKSVRLADAVSKLLVMKPNRGEASLLTGVDIQSDADLPAAAQAFFGLGLRNVLISLGEDGVYFDDGRERGILPCYPTELVNTTGCGDAFIAAAALGCLNGKSLRTMAHMGLAAAALCAHTDGAVSAEISAEAIEQIIQPNIAEGF